MFDGFAMMDWVAWIKIILAATGATLIAAAQQVEPSEAVWIMSLAGGLLGVAIGEDKSIRTIVTHAALGIAVAIAMATIAEFLVHFLRAPIAFFSALFGANMTVAINKDIEKYGPSALLPKWFKRRDGL